MDPKYIAGSLKRESCKVLLKEFNKEPAAGRASYSSSCALGDLTQGSGDPICCLTCSRLLRLQWLAAKWERDNLKHMSYCNNSKHLPSELTFTSSM